MSPLHTDCSRSIKTLLRDRQHSLRHFLQSGLVKRCFDGSGMSLCAKSSSEDTTDHKHVLD